MAIKILEWRCAVAAAGTYLQGFYRSLDGKQWDRAERMSRGVREFLDRHHPELRPSLALSVAGYRAQEAENDCLSEQTAWRDAIRSLMCLVSFFGMVGAEGKGVVGLQGWRSDATRSLGVALQASRTAFPKEELARLVDEALTLSLTAATCVLEQDLIGAGISEDRDSGVIASSLREACEIALRAYTREQLGE